MIKDWIFYLCNQSLLSLLLLPLFLIISYAFKKSKVADLRSDLWTFYFVLILIPFQKIGQWLSADKISKVQWVQLQSPQWEQQSVVSPSVGYELSWLDFLFLLWIVGWLFHVWTFVLRPLFKEKRMIAEIVKSSDLKVDSLEFPSKTIVTNQSIMPFVFGFFSPQIVFSIKLLDHFSTKQIKAILSHEKAHQRFFDPLRLFLARLVASLFWFNPLLLYAGRRLLEAIELRADQYAFLQQPHLKGSEYAKTLMDIMTLQANNKWSHLGLGLISKNQMLERISAMKNKDTRSKPNLYIPVIVLFFLLPISFSVGGLTSGNSLNSIVENNKSVRTLPAEHPGGSSEGIVTLTANIYHRGKVVARPTMISPFGEASQMIMGDNDGRGTWSLKVTVVPDGDYLKAYGDVCFTINKFKPGKMPKCSDKNRFEFAQKPGVPFVFDSPNNPYTYEFTIHKGAKTRTFLKHLDQNEHNEWIIKKNQKEI